MKLKFWGAAGTVTGSMHLIELENGKKILLDCGIYQGNKGFREEYNRSFPCPPSEIDYLILSHAHIDHCGNIPQLVKEGFKGNIYCTHATYDLVTIMLADSASIQEKDIEYLNKKRKKRGEPELDPLYTKKDVPPALERFVTLSYRMWFRIDEDIQLLFRDAGHMLGSATVTLKLHEGAKTTTLGFTGDIGRPDTMILRDPEPMPQVDYLISESTYGGKDHEVIPDAENKLADIIRETCMVNKGKLIIPAFSVGRTQMIVHTMDKMYNLNKLEKIPTYVDSPLAVNATRIFETHPECFDAELLEYMHYDPNPFGFSNLKYIRKVEDSKKLNDSREPAVIISASGMMTAGRILHHLKNNITDSRCTVLVVGYCARGTLGQRLVDGAEEVRIFGDTYPVKARILRLNAYSGHADQTEMYQFIRGCQDPKKLKQIFLVHGESNRSDLFKEHLESKGFSGVTVPKRGEVFEL